MLKQQLLLCFKQAAVVSCPTQLEKRQCVYVSFNEIEKLKLLRVSVLK